MTVRSLVFYFSILQGLIVLCGCGGSSSDETDGDPSQSDTDSDSDADADLDPVEIELVAVEWNTNSYVVGDEETVAVIDPGSRVDLIQQAVGERAVEYVILTHGHFDHITALDDILALFPDAKVAIHPDDEEFLYDISLNLSNYFTGEDYVFQGEVDEYLNHEDVIQIAGRAVEIIHTPGHSPGSICLLEGKQLLSGDTLMREQIGVIEGVPLLDEEQLIQSIRKRLFVLDDDVVVYPGHGETTTIGHEKVHSPAAQD